MQRKDTRDVPKVAIVILNWNGKKDTDACLISVKDIKYTNKEIILVDNGSEDGSADYFEEKYPEITLIKNKENLGFTGGNNVGVKKALENGAAYIMLLNNDTLVDENLIHGCLQQFLENKGIGLVGPKVVYYDHPENVWCAGGSYNSFLGRAVMYGTFSKIIDFEKAVFVDWISFCVVMIKRDVFEKIGYLDDAFFSSYEDLDFCLRSRKAGYLCAYTPSTTVQHKIAQDWGGLDNPLYIYYQTRNALLCMKKNRSVLGFFIFFFTYLTISMQKRFYRLISTGKADHVKYMYMGMFDFLQNNFYKGVLADNIRKEIKKIKTQKERNGKEQDEQPYTIGINARYLQRSLSGIERYIIELIAGLHRVDTKNNYLLFLNRDAPRPKIPTTANFKNVVSAFPTKQRFLRLLWEHFYLCYEIKKNNVTIFHGPAFFVPFFKPKKCKYIITVHDITFVKYPKTFTLGTRLYYKLLFPRSLCLADAIITDSKATKNDIINKYGIKPNKIQTIYLGISSGFLKQYGRERKEEIKQKYRLSEKFFLFTGVLSPRKNLETALAAFYHLKKEEAYKNHSFVIIGRKGWLYETIFTKMRELQLQDAVSFIEYVPEEELPIFYQLADMYLFPSLYEGFGLPILEAMASGCPVITSNVSSMPEVAGDAALLIDPNSVDELIAAVKRIRTEKNLRKTLQKKGYAQVKKFSWQKTAEQTAALYNKLKIIN